ncbi:MAG: hypothetical protein ACP5N7_01925 [Candidatus Pacearchaeota archaeon]
MLSLEKDKDLVIKTKEVLAHMAKGMSLSEAMIETNFQTVLRESPGAISETDAWKLVMEKYLPDDKLVRRHMDLLEKNDRDGNPDTQAVGKALELAYKIKGKLVDKVDLTTGGKALPASVVFNFNKKENDLVHITAQEPNGTNTTDN